MSANQTVPGSSAPDERLVGPVPLVAAPVGQVVGPADDGLADQHGAHDEGHLAQRPTGDRGRRAEPDGHAERVSRLCREQQEHGGRRGHGGSMPGGVRGGGATTGTADLSSPQVASDLHKRVRRHFEPVLEWSPRKGN